MAHVCPMCSDFSAPTFQLLQVHLFRVHSGDFNVTCCNIQFKTASAYRKHMQRNHRNVTTTSSSSQVTLEHEEDVGATNLSWDPENSDASPSNSLNSEANIAMWILKLKESNKLTQTSVNQILQHVSELCTITVFELGEAVNQALEAAGVKPDDVTGLKDLFSTSSPLSQPFASLLTYHQQLKFYNTHLNFIVSHMH